MTNPLSTDQGDVHQHVISQLTQQVKDKDAIIDGTTGTIVNMLRRAFPRELGAMEASAGRTIADGDLQTVLEVLQALLIKAVQPRPLDSIDADELTTALRNVGVATPRLLSAAGAAAAVAAALVSQERNSAPDTPRPTPASNDLADMFIPSVNSTSEEPTRELTATEGIVTAPVVDQDYEYVSQQLQYLNPAHRPVFFTEAEQHLGLTRAALDGWRAQERSRQDAEFRVIEPSNSRHSGRRGPLVVPTSVLDTAGPWAECVRSLKGKQLYEAACVLQPITGHITSFSVSEVPGVGPVADIDWSSAGRTDSVVALLDPTTGDEAINELVRRAIAKAYTETVCVDIVLADPGRLEDLRNSLEVEALSALGSARLVRSGSILDWSSGMQLATLVTTVISV